MKLPSDGRFWPIGSVELSHNRDLPVLSMTGKDEIILKTADALINGTATTDMIQSCIPNIKNAWDMPRIDLDAILIAIRIASYGDKLDVDVKCPKCQTVDSYEADLHYLMENIHLPDYNHSLNINGIYLNFKPQSYAQYNKASLESFEQRRLVTQLTTADFPEQERAKQMKDIIKRVTEINVIQLTDNIESILIGDSKVIERAMIEEFLQNTDLETFTAIKNKINELNASYKMPNMRVHCKNCQHEFESSIELDPATFFAPGS